jgi:hypothetical protein
MGENLSIRKSLAFLKFGKTQMQIAKFKLEISKGRVFSPEVYIFHFAVFIFQ